MREADALGNMGFARAKRMDYFRCNQHVWKKSREHRCRLALGVASLVLFSIRPHHSLSEVVNLGVAALESFCSSTTPTTPNVTVPASSPAHYPTHGNMADTLKDVTFKSVQVDALVRTNMAKTPHQSPAIVPSPHSAIHDYEGGRTDQNYRSRSKSLPQAASRSPRSPQAAWSAWRRTVYWKSPTRFPSPRSSLRRQTAARTRTAASTTRPRILPLEPRPRNRTLHTATR
jgi:hypothetical protein